MIGAIGGVDPATGDLAGDTVEAQTAQILTSFDIMLQSVGSDLDHIVHITAYLKAMDDFDRMNDTYVRVVGERRPARTVIGVNELPKPGFLLTMNLTAVVARDETSA